MNKEDQYNSLMKRFVQLVQKVNLEDSELEQMKSIGEVLKYYHGKRFNVHSTQQKSDTSGEYVQDSQGINAERNWKKELFPSPEEMRLLFPGSGNKKDI